MDISTVFASITIMGMIGFFGYLIGRKTAITNEVKRLVIAIIVHIGLPAMILHSFFHVKQDQLFVKQLLIVFILSLFLNTLAVMIGWVIAFVFRMNVCDTKKIAILSGVGNVAFIGIPLCALLFGPIGALYAAVFNIGLDIVLWIISKSMYKFERITVTNPIMNTPFIVVIIGLLVFVKWDYTTPISYRISCTCRKFSYATHYGLYRFTYC